MKFIPNRAKLFFEPATKEKMFCNSHDKYESCHLTANDVLIFASTCYFANGSTYKKDHDYKVSIKTNRNSKYFS